LPQQKGTLTASKLASLLTELEKNTGKIQTLLLDNDLIKEIAAQIKDAGNCLFLGRGQCFSVH